MAEPFLSEIRIMSFVFAPKGWALCNGQLLPINQNQALFSLLGTTIPPRKLLCAGPAEIYAAPSQLVALNAATVSNTGGSQAHLNMQPFLVLSFCIALQGIFPSQT